jgi:alpha-glucosidase
MPTNLENMRWRIPIFWLTVCVALLGSRAGVECADQTNSWSLSSPNTKCTITLSLNAAGNLSYMVLREESTILKESPLGLVRDDQSFERGLTFRGAERPMAKREQYQLFAGVMPQVNKLLNHRTIEFQNANRSPLKIELAAGDEGVAFRYRFPEPSGHSHIIQSELTGFALPTESKGWLQPYHAASQYTPAYEDFYFNVSPGSPPPESRAKPVGWCFPALFEVSSGVWALLTESGTDGSYCACHLGPDSTGGLYRIAFPLTNETTKGWTNQIDPEPRFTLPWNMPWRVIAIGSAADIATSTLVTDLAPGCRIPDVSWIKPGRVSWSWWSHADSPNTVEIYKHFTDFAAKMNWEYTMFDAGWWKAGLTNIAGYAISKGVMPLAWLYATDFYYPKKRVKKLDEMAVAGIRGVKVDFWCSDRQEAIIAMQGLFEEAAARHMVVDLHGCTMPRGWQRTWPNFLAAEAVLGAESYFFESRYPDKAAELNTVLPFTRNVVGPMDSTPVACTLKKFPRKTTAAHELATALIFTSGLIHYADNPEFFESLPKDALQVLHDAPARWDETRCLIGQPGRVVVFARRAGDTWFIAGINGTDATLPIDLDLAAFAAWSRRLVVLEGANALMQVGITTPMTSSRWKHEVPPRGGFILRLEKER